jgi:hypothetical protein
MKAHLSIDDISGKRARAARRMSAIAALGACLFLIGCTAGGMTLRPDAELQPIGQAPSNFDTAVKQNQAALLERKGPPDVALYNIGLILSHPSNPKKDPPKALHSFRTLIAEHPRSPFGDQAKTWILVLEQQQKNADEKQRLIEERRALSREREMLALERQKLNYASEKSQQLDLEIERRRRQSLSK